MIAKYIAFLVVINGLGYLSNYLVFPIAYLFRKPVRKHRNLWVCRFLWWYLNDTIEYGDKEFQRKYKTGESKWDYFCLAYKWARRNPQQNLYYDLPSYKVKNGKDVPEVLLYAKTTSRKATDLLSTKWRTIKYKDAADKYHDKHGEYIDYTWSLLGKQYMEYTLDGVKLWRYSVAKAIYIPWLKRIFTREIKLGYEHNWTIHNKYGALKADEKAIREYKQWKQQHIINSIVYGE